MNPSYKKLSKEEIERIKQEKADKVRRLIAKKCAELRELTGKNVASPKGEAAGKKE
ncbi:MAG: hypothetical protein WC862_03740 [Patescibacteria group bacterium]